MSKSKFIVLANNTINHIADSIIDQDHNGVIDINFIDNDVLYLSISCKQFVINTHTATSQIWMVSPISGPHHFRYVDGKWLNRNKEELILLLHTELNSLLDFRINLLSSNE